MSEYQLGKQRTRHDHTRSVVIHVTVPKRIFDRIASMRDALQKEIGPDVPVSVASMTRRILYAHPALQKLSHRHYRPSEIDTDADIVT